jgi:hypothetical protein
MKNLYKNGNETSETNKTQKKKNEESGKCITHV